MPLLRHLLLALLFAQLLAPLATRAATPQVPPHLEAAPADQSLAAVNRKSIGCLGCHERTDAMSMHDNPAVKLGCTDCHGGDASVIPPRGLARMGLECQQL